MPLLNLGICTPSSSDDDDTDQIPIIWAVVDEVKFSESIKVCREKKTIKAPHWKLGENVEDGMGSKLPAVYLVKSAGKSWEAEVNVNINKLENVSGKAKLVGYLEGLRFEGEFTPKEGASNPVTVKVDNVPDEISHYRGTMSWGLELKDPPLSVGLNTSRAELFFVLADPTKHIFDKGVWIEALRFLRYKVMITGEDDKDEAARKITKYCFQGHGLKYDILSGASHYHITPGTMDKFLLADYIDSKVPFANCYDQASAVKALSAAIGVKVKWLFMSPFGYINQTSLLGVGECNNPFYPGVSTPIDLLSSAEMHQVLMKWKKVATDDPKDKRTSFGNHAFCDLSSKIHDACAGPCLGTQTLEEYAVTSIDTGTLLNNGTNFSKDKKQLKSRLSASIKVDVYGVKQVK